MSKTAFSDDGQAAIERAIDICPSASSHESLENLQNVCNVDRTIELIRQHDYNNVALQFPDELLNISTLISDVLKKTTGKNVFILADMSYGSCCVDEVAAEHVSADFIVHYGRACLSPTRRLPVQYAFGQAAIDMDDFMEKFEETFQQDAERHILVMYDVVYHYCIDTIQSRISTNSYPNVIISTLEKERILSATSSKSGRQYTLNPNIRIHDYTILYIGGESLKLTNIIITHPSCTVIAYDPETKQCHTQNTQVNRLLNRRYFMLQKARDADVFGIVVGTLGVASYLPVINNLKALIKSKSKKSYTLAVGKPNPAKLGNFLEIECFVLVACPENSLIDSKEFLRPIVTPFELELALSGQDGEWVGKDLPYVTDLEEMRVKLERGLAVPSGDSHSNGQPSNGVADGDSEDEPHFSLVTGKYKQSKKYTASNHSNSIAPDGNSNVIAIRNQNTTLTVNSGSSAAIEYLHQRTYQGLDARIGQTEVSDIIIEGRIGIARGYVGEGDPSTDSRHVGGSRSIVK